MDVPPREGLVLVLGAGFSRALHRAMPLIDELGDAAAKVAGIGRPRVPVPFTGGSFEVWLSRQAQPQPYRSATADADAHALYVAFTEAIAAVIDERVADALTRGAPSWLTTLLRVAHARDATILTFNYDPLVECAIEGAQLYDWRAQQSDWRQPPGQPVDFRHVLAGSSPRMHGGWMGIEDVADLHFSSAQASRFHQLVRRTS